MDLKTTRREQIQDSVKEEGSPQMPFPNCNGILERKQEWFYL